MRILITGADGQLGRDLLDCLAGRVPDRGSPLRAARARRARDPGLNHEVLGTDIDTMRVDDRDAVLHNVHRVPARARPARWRVHRGRPVRDRGRRGLRGQRHRHPQRRRGGRPGGGAHGLRLDRLRLRRHRRPPLPRVGRHRARRRSTAPPSWRASASAGPGSTIVRTSWLCGAHGANMVVTALRLADGRRRAALRRRPARVADVHRRPGARRRHPRARPPARASST